jgi:hypothetical protein
MTFIYGEPAFKYRILINIKKMGGSRKTLKEIYFHLNHYFSNMVLQEPERLICFQWVELCYRDFVGVLRRL